MQAINRGLDQENNYLLPKLSKRGIELGSKDEYLAHREYPIKVCQNLLNYFFGTLNQAWRYVLVNLIQKHV